MQGDFIEECVDCFDRLSTQDQDEIRAIVSKLPLKDRFTLQTILCDLITSILDERRRNAN